MLYTTTVAPSTWGLLIKLMKLPSLQNFGLVGGTNLSLRYGHRLSIDLDLFTDVPFNNDKILIEIERTFLNIEVADESKNMLFLFVEGVKVDIVLVPYPNIAPFDVFDEIRLTSCPDVIAMKCTCEKRQQKRFLGFSRNI